MYRRLTSQLFKVEFHHSKVFTREFLLENFAFYAGKSKAVVSVVLPDFKKVCFQYKPLAFIVA